MGLGAWANTKNKKKHWKVELLNQRVIGIKKHPKLTGYFETTGPVANSIFVDHCTQLTELKILESATYRLPTKHQVNQTYVAQEETKDQFKANLSLSNQNALFVRVRQFIPIDSFSRNNGLL